MTRRYAVVHTGLCSECGARRDLTGSQDVERHTRKVKGGNRVRCAGTGRKPRGWRA